MDGQRSELPSVNVTSPKFLCVILVCKYANHVYHVIWSHLAHANGGWLCITCIQKRKSHKSPKMYRLSSYMAQSSSKAIFEGLLSLLRVST